MGHRHHHHHHHHSLRIAGNRSPWLRSLPPWRLRGINGIGGVFLAAVYVGFWFLEFEIWMAVWCYYGAFLVLRWCWRNNPIGKIVDAVSAGRERRQRPPYDPHGTPTQHYDLGGRNQL